MKKPIITLGLALLGMITIVNAQERLTPSQSKHYAQLTRQQPLLLANAPLHVEADLDRSVALTMDDFGGLLIPIEGLAEKTEADVDTEPVAIGELWLYNLTLEKNGWAISESQLNVIPLNSEEGRVRVPRYILAVCKSDGKTPTLMIYSKGNKPLMTLPLSGVEESQPNPLNMSATDTGTVKLTILGQYQATFTVAELFL